MNKKCSVCGQPAEPEPGFYYGAMYMSYALCVAVCGFNFVLTEFILKLPPYSFLVVNTVMLIVLWPLIFRYARVLYIYLFIRYDPNAAENNKQN